MQCTQLLLPILKFVSGEVPGSKSALKVELVPLECRLCKACDGDLWFKCLGVGPAVAPDPLQSETKEWKVQK